MTDKYFIVDITEGEDSAIGRIAVARANPVEVRPNGMMCASESRVGAELFYLPLDNYFLQSIIAEQRRDSMWHINPKDFKDKYTFWEPENRRRRIHCHKSLCINEPQENWLKRIFRKLRNK